MAVILKCPVCEKKYRWNAGAEEAPQYCPNPDCDWEDVKRADDDIVMPFIRTSGKTSQVDKMYRDMEAGSERRVEMAAELAGTSKDEMSGLKITNLNDRKDAEIAAPNVVNAVTQHMEAMNARGAKFGFGGGDALGYSGAVQAGPAPNAGAKMRSQLHAHHTTLSRGAAVSDAPALETQQPGYVRRG